MTPPFLLSEILRSRRPIQGRCRLASYEVTSTVSGGGARLLVAPPASRQMLLTMLLPQRGKNVLLRAVHVFCKVYEIIFFPNFL